MSSVLQEGVTGTMSTRGGRRAEKFFCVLFVVDVLISGASSLGVSGCSHGREDKTEMEGVE